MSHIAPTPQTYCTRSAPCALCRLPAVCLHCGGTPLRIESKHPVPHRGTGRNDLGIAYDASRMDELLVERNMLTQYTRTEVDTNEYAPGAHLDPSAEASANQVQDAVGNEMQFHPSLSAHFTMPETEWSYQCNCDSTRMQPSLAAVKPEQHLNSAGPSKKASAKGSAGSHERRVSTNRCPPGSACDACHAAKIGCSGFESGRPCGPCLARHTVCEKTRLIGKAGRPPGTGKKVSVESDVVVGIGFNAPHSN